MRERSKSTSILILVATAALLLALFFCSLSVGAVAHASEPEQTYNIHSVDDFTAYAKAYALGDRNPKDILNISINSGNAITDDTFISIGTSSRPFAGTLVIPTAGLDVFKLYNCPLFDYVSTDMRLTGAGTAKIMRERLGESPADGVLTSGAAFANHVVAGTSAASWSVALIPHDGEGAAATDHTGLFGEIAASASVTVSLADTSALAVSGDGAVGLICGTLGAGASLTVSTSGSGATRTVTSTGGNAGGLVGTMQNGATLTIASGNNTRISAVTGSHYAGGIVGSAVNPTIDFADGVTSYAITSQITGTTAAGGIFGYYKTQRASETFSMEKFAPANNLNVASSTAAGGVFGQLVSECAELTFDGKASSGKAFSFLLSSGDKRGGVAGSYASNALSNLFEIKDLDISVSAAVVSQVAGGVIGSVTDAPAYLYLHDVEATASDGTPTAGLIGSLGAGGSFADVKDVTIGGSFDGGLIGTMSQGVLRIRGITDFSAYTQQGWSSGLIVRNRGRALVYALGDGEGGGWTLKRNLSNGIDDVGGWGEVLRVDGTTLAESDLFTVDGTAHTVTVKAAVTAIGTVTQFALTALNVQLNTEAAVGALCFTSGSANTSATLLAGSLSLTADLSLAKTGLTGFTRDDGGNDAFSGSFDGGSHVLTLAIGEKYGLNGSGAALAADSKQGNIYRHTYNGLFAEIGGGASVEDLTISGKIIVYQSEDKATVYAGALAAYCSGTLTLSELTVDVTLTYKTTGDHSFCFGGALGTATGSALSLSVTDSDIHPIVSDITEASKTARTNSALMGGVIGRLAAGSTASPTQSVAISSSSVGLTYTKTINTARESAFGGVIAQIGDATYVKDRRAVTLTTVALSVTATGTAAGGRFGGLLGTEWLACDVTLNGLSVSATVTATGSQTPFGGLTQRATGRWNIADLSLTSASYTLPNNSSSFGFVTNKSVNSSLNNALYLDVDVTNSHYDISALTFTTDPAFASFDELVASSVATGANVTQNGNSIVSVTTSAGGQFDTSGTGYTTYLNQTAYGRTNAGAVNPNTRYYYNLAYARANLSTPKYKYLIWSVYQYAHSSLSAWFATDNSFTGSLDMTGLSYYPIDFSGTVTFTSVTIVLDNVLTESSVHYAYRYDDNGLQTSTARTTRNSTNQHYLMHTALFRDVVGTMTISTATLSGNVPKLSDTFCGFLIAGKAGGSDGTKAKLAFSSVTFSGVYVHNAGAHYTDTTYAPLAVNKIGKNSVLDWDGASGASYSSYNGDGYYAGSSLIGDVGDATARAIYLTFSGIVFDSRTSATSIDNFDTVYGTSKTIFSRATILNSFLYFGESSGTYNFAITEDRTSSVSATHAVTYGREITSSVENAGKQKKYYGSEYYVHPTAYQAASEYDFSSGFRPYVYVAYNLGEQKHELAVNVTFTSVIDGCGKYGDPYVIDNDDNLPIISSIIAGVDVGSTVQLNLPSDLTDYDYTSTSYTKYLYNFNTVTMSSSNGGADQDREDVRRYLAGAYYVITRDITLPSGYTALGTTDSEDSPEYAFRGVIVGSGNPVITNQSPKPLIHTSNGCVVKGVTIDVDVNYASSNVVTLSAPQGSATYKYNNGIQSYGAVIGQVLGGDTFIDGVQVTFTDVAFSVTTGGSSSKYPRLTPIGGYIGVVVNGGVIFRNMTSANVGLTSAVYNKISDDGYLYVNPIIGRVIAGYAFHESATYHATEEDCTLKNGLKNYTIADLSLSAGKLGVTYSSSTYTVTVPDGQALFVLGAVVNSGSASAAYDASAVNGYQALSDFWSAYRAHTTARAGAAYSYVGEAGFSSASDYTDYAVNDTYTDTGAKIPYIVRAYTVKSGSAYLARCICTTNQVVVNVTGDCDVAAGFRGIGSNYLSNDYLRLRIKSMSGRKGSTTNSYRITLYMRYLEYNHLNVSKYIAVAPADNSGMAGFGLFNKLIIASASSTNCVQYLELAGSIFYDVYKLAGDGGQASYNYAPFKDNDRSELKDLKTGATNTEDATMRRTILSVGGLAGMVNAKCYIKNVTFKDLSIEGAKYAGGLIGLLYTNATNNNNMCNIVYESGVANAGYVNVVGGQCAGGLIGKIFKSAAQIDGATGGTDIIIRTIEAKDSNPDENGLTYFANMNTGVGGLIGNSWGSDKSGAAYPSSLASVTIDNKGQNPLYISNINIVKGTTAATIRVRNDRANNKDDRANYAGGFVGSVLYNYLKITDCNVKGVNISANIAGGIVGRLTQHYYLEVFNCSVDGSFTSGGTTRDAAIEGTRYAGGVVGWVVGRDKLYFQLRDFTVKNYRIESKSTLNSVMAAAGGVVGYAEGNNVPVSEGRNVICQFNNLTVLNCLVKTNYNNEHASAYIKYKCGTGGVIGAIDSLKSTDSNGYTSTSQESARDGDSWTTSNKYKFSGYNILVKDCTFTHLNGGSSDDSTSATNRRIGDIVGNNAISTTIKFVGVSVQNNNYCGKHVGIYNSDSDNYGSDGTFGTGYLVLANYSGITAGTALAGIDDGTTSTDNYTNVPAAYPYVTVNPTLMIGGMTMTGDGVASAVDTLPIQNIISDGASGRYGYAVSAYYSGSSGNTNLQTFSAFTGKLSMFSSEASGYLGTDFPVLIVDDTNPVNSHKMINSYLRLLTNTVHDFGADAANVYSVVI